MQSERCETEWQGGSNATALWTGSSGLEGCDCGLRSDSIGKVKAFVASRCRPHTPEGSMNWDNLSKTSRELNVWWPYHGVWSLPTCDHGKWFSLSTDCGDWRLSITQGRLLWGPIHEWASASANGHRQSLLGRQVLTDWVRSSEAEIMCMGAWNQWWYSGKSSLSFMVFLSSRVWNLRCCWEEAGGWIVERESEVHGALAGRMLR